MPRIPPNLQYLTIYNPTLKPTTPTDDQVDDEDAEEQAHILFYTSKERAVSRDRMLRQVGLAKALVSFSEMFSGHGSCDNVHSQSKRMIMVSPEPDFWIHAAVELAKTPRTPTDKGKTKGKGKSNNAGSEGGQAAVYDNIDGSVHDLALRRMILRGYDYFKLIHGSFTYILSTLGKEALELQLERFFTVWAWSWDMEDGQEFGDHIGIPLHPSFRTLSPLLDTFSLEIPDAPLSILVNPPYVVPSSQYARADYSSSLSRHLLSTVPPSSSEDPKLFHDRDATITARDVPEPSTLSGKDPPKSDPLLTSVGNGPKWNWTGYLSFGRGTKKPPPEEIKAIPVSFEDPPADSVGSVELNEGDVDKSALLDAISGDMPLEHRQAGQVPFEEEKDRFPDTQIPTITDCSAVSEPPLQFSHTTVHLAATNPLLTVRQKVYYLPKNGMIFALVGLKESSIEGDPGLVQQVGKFLDHISGVIKTETRQPLSDSLPSVAKILQPTDSHIASIGNFAISSTDFHSKSPILYEAQAIQSRDAEISEVFSRGQNPQHWHIARRGLGSNENRKLQEGEAYMGVYRKEASLGDVDNVLASVVRRCGLGESSFSRSIQ